MKLLKYIYIILYTYIQLIINCFINVYLCLKYINMHNNNTNIFYTNLVTYTYYYTLYVKLFFYKFIINSKFFLKKNLLLIINLIIRLKFKVLYTHLKNFKHFLANSFLSLYENKQNTCLIGKSLALTTRYFYLLTYVYKILVYIVVVGFFIAMFLLCFCCFELLLGYTCLTFYTTIYQIIEFFSLILVKISSLMPLLWVKAVTLSPEFVIDMLGQPSTIFETLNSWYSRAKTITHYSSAFILNINDFATYYESCAYYILLIAQTSPSLQNLTLTGLVEYGLIIELPTSVNPIPRLYKEFLFKPELPLLLMFVPSAEFFLFTLQYVGLSIFDNVNWVFFQLAAALTSLLSNFAFLGINAHIFQIFTAANITWWLLVYKLILCFFYKLCFLNLAFLYTFIELACSFSNFFIDLPALSIFWLYQPIYLNLFSDIITSYGLLFLYNLRFFFAGILYYGVYPVFFIASLSYTVFVQLFTLTLNFVALNVAIPGEFFFIFYQLLVTLFLALGLDLLVILVHDVLLINSTVFSFLLNFFWNDVFFLHVGTSNFPWIGGFVYYFFCVIFIATLFFGRVFLRLYASLAHKTFRRTYHNRLGTVAFELVDEKLFQLSKIPFFFFKSDLFFFYQATALNENVVKYSRLDLNLIAPYENYFVKWVPTKNFQSARRLFSTCSYGLHFSINTIFFFFFIKHERANLKKLNFFREIQSITRIFFNFLFFVTPDTFTRIVNYPHDFLTFLINKQSGFGWGGQQLLSNSSAVAFFSFPWLYLITTFESIYWFSDKSLIYLQLERQLSLIPMFQYNPSSSKNLLSRPEFNSQLYGLFQVNHLIFEDQFASTRHFLYKYLTFTDDYTSNLKSNRRGWLNIDSSLLEQANLKKNEFLGQFWVSAHAYSLYFKYQPLESVWIDQNSLVTAGETFFKLSIVEQLRSALLFFFIDPLCWFTETWVSFMSDDAMIKISYDAFFFKLLGAGYIGDPSFFASNTLFARDPIKWFDRQLILWNFWYTRLEQIQYWAARLKINARLSAYKANPYLSFEHLTDLPSVFNEFTYADSFIFSKSLKVNNNNYMNDLTQFDKFSSRVSSQYLSRRLNTSFQYFNISDLLVPQVEKCGVWRVNAPLYNKFFDDFYYKYLSAKQAYTFKMLEFEGNRFFKKLRWQESAPSRLSLTRFDAEDIDAGNVDALFFLANIFTSNEIKNISTSNYVNSRRISQLLFGIHPTTLFSDFFLALNADNVIFQSLDFGWRFLFFKLSTFYALLNSFFVPKIILMPVEFLVKGLQHNVFQIFEGNSTLNDLFAFDFRGEKFLIVRVIGSSVVDFGTKTSTKGVIASNYMLQ